MCVCVVVLLAKLVAVCEHMCALCTCIYISVILIYDELMCLRTLRILKEGILNV